MLVKTTDGTPDAVKVARPVWSGGKSGDNFKGLPITIKDFLHQNILHSSGSQTNPYNMLQYLFFHSH